MSDKTEGSLKKVRLKIQVSMKWNTKEKELKTRAEAFRLYFTTTIFYFSPCRWTSGDLFEYYGESKRLHDEIAWNITSIFYKSQVFSASAVEPSYS